MSPVRDFLQRLWPAGTPGGAAAAVPADHSRDLAAELAPVVSALAGVEAECARILSEADSDARRIRDDACHRADDMVAAARQQADAARADAAAAALAGAEAAAAATAAAGERDAQAIRERAAQQMDLYVSQAVASVRMLARGGAAGDRDRDAVGAGRAS